MLGEIYRKRIMDIIDLLFSMLTYSVSLCIFKALFPISSRKSEISLQKIESDSNRKGNIINIYIMAYFAGLETFSYTQVRDVQRDVQPGLMNRFPKHPLVCLHNIPVFNNQYMTYFYYIVLTTECRFATLWGYVYIYIFIYVPSFICIQMPFNGFCKTKRHPSVAGVSHLGEVAILVVMLTATMSCVEGELNFSVFAGFGRELFVESLVVATQIFLNLQPGR